MNGNDNYLDVEAAKVEVTIGKSQLVVDWGATQFVYNGEEQKPEAMLSGVWEDEDPLLTVEGAQIHAGKYTAKAKVANPNYELVENTEVEFEITPMKLSVSGVEVKTEKDFDGNNTAEILSTEISTNVLDGDEVSVKVEVEYEDAEVGKGKLITVTLTVSGNTDYYIADEDSRYVYTHEGEIIGNPITNVISVDVNNKFLCGNQVLLTYEVLSGKVERYSITFDNPLLKPQEGAARNSGEILIDLPENLEAGTYSGQITFSDRSGNVSYPCNFSFTTKLPAKTLYQLYKDGVFVNGEYAGYIRRFRRRRRYCRFTRIPPLQWSRLTSTSLTSTIPIPPRYWFTP